jgi:hypothetical protein
VRTAAAAVQRLLLLLLVLQGGVAARATEHLIGSADSSGDATQPAHLRTESLVELVLCAQRSAFVTETNGGSYLECRTGHSLGPNSAAIIMCSSFQ